MVGRVRPARPNLVTFDRLTLLIVFMCLLLTACTVLRDTDAEFTNPDSGGRVVIQSAHPAGRLAIRAGRGLFMRDIFVGERDWMFGSAEALWSEDGMRVTVFVCGRISPPQVLTYDFHLGSTVTDDDAIDVFRARSRSKYKSAPFGCRITDPLYWPCCDKRYLLKYLDRKPKEGDPAAAKGSR